MKYTDKNADKLICKFLGTQSIGYTLDYGILFLTIDKIQTISHPKSPQYKFVFNMNNTNVWINLGDNTNGCDGYFNERFINPIRRSDAIRKLLFEWINWYNDILH